MTAPIGVIGGTALAELTALEAAGNPAPASTPYGPSSGPLVCGRFAGRDTCFVMRHGPGHRLAPHRINYRANIRALADAGCRQVIAVAAVGGITPAMRAGRIVVPDQIIDYSWGRAHSFHDDPAGGSLDHIDFTEPYDSALRTAILETARRLDLAPADGGVHGVTQGPRLETAAEIDRMERDGCDIVGMTGMPEAALAREAGLDYACCAVVVNKAAGRSGGSAIHAEIEATLTRGMANVERILEQLLPSL
ncbi:5'-methylthioadenosine phosphorylase [Salinisphaera orenii MK-B5]|uniref:Probable 6-oxopurine nucleoside phosphorylase n=1 Tax=Salinisphaera orenii MK-B5 TaxID=856730 RepID=A0A423PXV7_9GAMM|nr:S-methyl-5'-thioinosine phosphorylase [Salinisphaera orenii]ROO30385.1 5'-methylthioadenosine phosphorylase [Salinisphaera orenii MK-B5]